ncbi:MAG TPA: class I SAM-dependent methyltransferase [Longimicrobiales bacterium]|nr:class I SAM-dependent methyltransferase [Longimicrobiales bacterium]
MNDAERRVARFYETVGWKEVGAVTEDARRFEDLRDCARRYISRCRLRVLRHIPARGELLLDMASGPVQYPEYLEYSRHFAKRYCVDFSAEALARARERLGEHGVYLHGSFFDLELPADTFDCAVSLHTIYHMDRNRQEEAVRKLLRLVKPGRPVIVVYSNPDSLPARLRRSHPAGALRRLLARHAPAADPDRADGLYFFQHPNRWWLRFADQADIEIRPWRSLGSEDQKRLIPDSRLGTAMLDTLFRLEDRFPRFFAAHFQYIMVVLTRRAV